MTFCVLQCHRRTEGGVDVVFPVNTIAYNQMFGTFATGGGDGVVNFWDGGNKKRLVQVGHHTGCITHSLIISTAARQHNSNSSTGLHLFIY